MRARGKDDAERSGSKTNKKNSQESQKKKPTTQDVSKRKSTKDVVTRAQTGPRPFSALVDIHVIVRNRRLHSAAAVAAVVVIHVSISVWAHRSRQRSTVQPKLAPLAQIHTSQSEVQSLHVRPRPTSRSRVRRGSQLSLASSKPERFRLERKRLARRIRLGQKMCLSARGVTHRRRSRSLRHDTTLA